MECFGLYLHPPKIHVSTLFPPNMMIFIVRAFGRGSDHWPTIIKLWSFLFYLRVHAQSLQSCQFFVTPWTVALQAPLSMGFSRKEYWSVLPCPPPGDLLDPGIESTFLVAPASSQILHWWATEEVCMIYTPTELSSRLPYFKAKPRHQLILTINISVLISLVR